MKTLRRLQLRQGQELSQSEQQYVVAGERFFCESRVGVCTCTRINDTHGETLYGYTLSNDWLGVAVGGVGVLVGIGSIYASGGTSVPGYSSVIGGVHMVYSSINQRKSAIRHATMTLVNTNPKTHTETIH